MIYHVEFSSLNKYLFYKKKTQFLNLLGKNDVQQINVRPISCHHVLVDPLIRQPGNCNYQPGTWSLMIAHGSATPRSRGFT